MKLNKTHGAIISNISHVAYLISNVGWNKN